MNYVDPTLDPHPISNILVKNFLAYQTCEKFNLLLEIAYGESVRPLIPLQEDFNYYLSILHDYLPTYDNYYNHTQQHDMFNLFPPFPVAATPFQQLQLPYDIDEDDYKPGTDGKESHSFINKKTLLELIGLNDDSTYHDVYQFLEDLKTDLS